MGRLGFESAHLFFHINWDKTLSAPVEARDDGQPSPRIPREKWSASFEVRV
jgi:hypothetical protein